VKNFNDLNYYELLRVAVDATIFELKQAYTDALAIYAHDSLATYSLFSEKERQAILKTLETAFRTLSDPARREAYDQSLVNAGSLDPATLASSKPRKPVPLFETAGVTDKTHLNEKISKKINDASISQLSRDITAAEKISGCDLKKLREKIGVSLEEIYAATRISITTIKAIEADDYQSLPSELYLKNFLRSYASLVKLEPQIVIDGYFKQAGFL
jgi:DnaJ-class molecular chaperone